MVLLGFFGTGNFDFTQFDLVQWWLRNTRPFARHELGGKLDSPFFKIGKADQKFDEIGYRTDQNRMEVLFPVYKSLIRPAPLHTGYNV